MRYILRRMFGVALLVAALFAAAPVPALAEDMCAEHTLVMIDIKPGSEANKVNLSSQGLLPVAVLTSDEFDASQFALEAAHLSDAASAAGCSGASAVRSQIEDVNNDGRPDLVLFFRIQDLNFGLDTAAAMLMAHGTYNGVGMHIMGADSVQVKPQ